MAEPALREQLTSYIARRVHSQCESVFQFYEQCSASDWVKPSENHDLLDACEKLTKLARKLPSNSIAEHSYQICSLLKLENLSEKPSHRARKGISDALASIKENELASEGAIRTTAEAKQSMAPWSKLHHAVFALNNDTLKASLRSLLRDMHWRCSELDESTLLSEDCCLFIDTNYKSPEGGFDCIARLEDKLLQAPNHKRGAIIYISENDTLEHRLKATRHHANGFVVKPNSAFDLLRQTNQVLGEVIRLAPKVLVVDDSLSQLKYVENILLKEGFECRTLNDPSIFLEKMQAHQPDIVLLDMYMPSCSGLELAQVLQQHPIFKSTPCIFLSAEDDETILKQTIAATRAPFLVKPVSSSALTSKINQLLSTKPRD